MDPKEKRGNCRMEAHVVAVFGSYLQQYLEVIKKRSRKEHPITYIIIINIINTLPQLHPNQTNKHTYDLYLRTSIHSFSAFTIFTASAFALTLVRSQASYSSVPVSTASYYPYRHFYCR